MKRRDILKRTTTGLAAGVAASGIASATGAFDQRRLEALAEPDAVRATLEANRGFLEGLVEEGVLDTADPAEFDLRSSSAPKDFSEGVDVQAARVGHTGTPAVITSRFVDDGMLTVYLLPDRGDRYALLRDGDGEVVEGFNAEPESDCDPCYYESCTCDQYCCGDQDPFCDDLDKDRYCCDETCICVCDCDACPYTCPICES